MFSFIGEGSQQKRLHPLRGVEFFFYYSFFFIRHNGGFPWWDLTGYGTKKRRQLCFAITVVTRKLLIRGFAASVVRPSPMKGGGSTDQQSSKSWMLRTGKSSRPKQVCCLRDLTPSGVGSLFYLFSFFMATTTGSHGGCPGLS